MSDWWARKLGQAPPQHTQPQGTPHVPAPPPLQQQPMAPVPQQYAPEGQVVQQQAHPQPDGEVPLTELLRTKQYQSVPVQAQALTNTGGQCPGCGSGNFYKGTQTGGGAHCHDCGYPLVQSGSGMGALSAVRATGPAQAAQSPSYDQQLGG
jgi:hypothetical protein